MPNNQPNMKSYEEEYKNFSWQISRNELGYKDGDIINIGRILHRQNLQNGKSKKTCTYLGRF